MNTYFSEITKGINEIIEIWEPKLISLPDNVLTGRSNKQSRTIKEIIGHLIDSASNNHQRMVRLQYNTELVFPDYRQDNDRWIALQNYEEAKWKHLVQLWKYFNLHIIHLIENIDKTKLDNFWQDFEGSRVTLEKMINGYLIHLHLHMKEIQELIDNE